MKMSVRETVANVFGKIGRALRSRAMTMVWVLLAQTVCAYGSVALFMEL